MLTWANKAFNVCQTSSGIMAHMVDDLGVIIFRWRMYYGPTSYEEVNIPFGVIEEFETFRALCRQFDTPSDLKTWYLKRINRNDRKQIRK